MGYRGRFAPSPTGPLHFGSLVAAAASWLDARAAGGEWLLRMEDLDTPRCVPGAADDILRTLEACGLTWDGAVEWQSGRLEAYRAALERLVKEGCAYPCGCTRKEVMEGTEEGRYPGTCRGGLRAGRVARAWRLRVRSGVVSFEDRVQGRQEQEVERACGDFVLLRADGIFAYQLAVVVDDARQGVTDVVRGADLLSSTPRQMVLQEALGVETPRYLHVPVAANGAGEKLSKQTRARAARVGDLRAVLRFLGLEAPDLEGGELLAWAVGAWEAGRVPRVGSVEVEGLG
ncbi:MAG: tRNA glutamyl-Q(34) synthetase GluQRS [Solibacteraceae bacterium]|nr:tRNA glutamyl-Q(34) synthetase GluQRS [Solibacteraceae bacterium]